MIPSQAFSATLPRAIKGPQTASPTGQLQILVPPRGRIFLRTSSFRHTRSPPVPAPALPDHPILSHPPPHPVGFSDRWIFQKVPLHHPPHSLVNWPRCGGVVVWLVHRFGCPCDRSPITWSLNGPRVGERRSLSLRIGLAVPLLSLRSFRVKPVLHTIVWGREGEGSQGYDPGTVQGQSRDSPGTAQGQSWDSPGTVQGQSRDSPGTVQGQSRDSPGTCWHQ